LLTAVVIISFLPSQAESRRREGQILGLKPGIIIDIYPDNGRKKRRKERKMKERQRTMDMKKKNDEETKSYIITAMICVLKCHFLTVKYELGGSCW
jgi:hypothetical protein